MKKLLNILSHQIHLKLEILISDQNALSKLNSSNAIHLLLHYQKIYITTRNATIITDI